MARAELSAFVGRIPRRFVAMSPHPTEPDLTDPENPEWTKADFANAVGPEGLPQEVRSLFPKTRGRPKKLEAKVPVSIRLDPDVVGHFRQQGPGWQSRMNDVLREHMTGRFHGSSTKVSAGQKAKRKR